MFAGRVARGSGVGLSVAFGWQWEFGVREGFRGKKHFFWNLKGLTGIFERTFQAGGPAREKAGGG